MMANNWVHMEHATTAAATATCGTRDYLQVELSL